MDPHHIKKISEAYWLYKDLTGFATIIGVDKVLENNGNLSVQLYVKQENSKVEYSSSEMIKEIKETQMKINESYGNLLNQLDNIGIGK